MTHLEQPGAGLQVNQADAPSASAIRAVGRRRGRHESRFLCGDRLFDQTAFRALEVLDPKSEGTEVVVGVAE